MESCWVHGQICPFKEFEKFGNCGQFLSAHAIDSLQIRSESGNCLTSDFDLNSQGGKLEPSRSILFLSSWHTWQWRPTTKLRSRVLTHGAFWWINHCYTTNTDLSRYPVPKEPTLYEAQHTHKRHKTSFHSFRFLSIHLEVCRGMMLARRSCCWPRNAGYMINAP